MVGILLLVIMKSDKNILATLVTAPLALKSATTPIPFVGILALNHVTLQCGLRLNSKPQQGLGNLLLLN